MEGDYGRNDSDVGRIDSGLCGAERPVTITNPNNVIVESVKRPIFWF